MEEEIYDLIIVSAGCVDATMAYHARKNGKTDLLLEKETSVQQIDGVHLLVLSKIEPNTLKNI